MKKLKFFGVILAVFLMFPMSGRAGPTYFSVGNVYQQDLELNKADPAVVFDGSTALDTDFWIGLTADEGGDDNDSLQIGKGIVPGTTPYFTMDKDGNVTLAGSLTIKPDGTNEVFQVNDGTIDFSDGNAGTIGVLTIDASGNWSYAKNIAAVDLDGIIGSNTPAAGTFTTLVSDSLNTGQGAYELYAMNQDVESTDKPTFLGKPVSTKTDSHVVTSADFGKSLRMNSADDKSFTLPSVGTTEDGARLTFIKQGAGKMTLIAVDTDYIDSSSATGTIYTTTNYATITLEYVHGMTRWVIISANGTYTLT